MIGHSTYVAQQFRSSLSVLALATSLACSPTDEGGPDTDVGGSSGGPAGLCGNGIVDDDRGEECDAGNELDPQCRADCLWPTHKVWEFNEAGAGGGNDWARSVVIDDQDNVYVGGIVYDGVSSDLWVRKLDAQGNPLWTMTYDDSDGLAELANGLAIHPSGDLIAAGFNEGKDGAINNIMVRMRPEDGSIVWAQAHGTMDVGRYALDITILPDGNIVLAGRQRSGSLLTDIWVAKFDDTGILDWSDFQPGELQGGNDSAHEVVSDPQGNIYVAGMVQGPQGFTGWLRKYDSDGNRLWTTVDDIDGPYRSNAAIAMASSGHLIVASDMSNTEMGLRQFNSGGSIVAPTLIDPGSVMQTLVGGLAVADDESVYLAGTSADANATSTTTWLGRYDQGQLRWMATPESEAGASHQSYNLAVDSQQRVVVVGSRTVAGNLDIWAAQYEQW